MYVQHKTSLPQTYVWERTQLRKRTFSLTSPPQVGGDYSHTSAQKGADWLIETQINERGKS